MLTSSGETDEGGDAGSNDGTAEKAFVEIHQRYKIYAGAAKN